MRTIARCQQYGIRVPTIYLVEEAAGRIYMSYNSQALTMRDYIFSVVNTYLIATEPSVAIDGLNKVTITLAPLLTAFGQCLAQLHCNDLVHGDLTTSNVLWIPESKELTLIDFGLSCVTRLYIYMYVCW